MMFKNTIENFTLIFEACKREFKMIFSDSAVVMSYILSTLAVAFFYSYVYSNEVFTDLPVAVVDSDQTSMSHQISRMIDATPELHAAYTTASLEKAKTLYQEGIVKGIVAIPKGFSRELQKGDVPAISVYGDASYMLYYKQTLTAVMQSVGTLSGQVEIKKMISNGIPMQQAMHTRRPFGIVGIPLFNINVGYATFLIPIVFIIAVQTLQLTAMGILNGTLREKRIFAETFSYARKKFSSVFLTLGRAMAYLIISMVLLLIQIVIVMHVYTFPQRGNLWEIIVFLIPVILSITFLGMAMTSLFRRREDAIMTVTIFSIPTLVLCGLSWPTTAFPVWAKIVSVFIPSTLGVKGFISLSQFGASLYEIRDVYIQMWGLCLFYFVFAVLTNRKYLQKGNN